MLGMLRTFSWWCSQGVLHGLDTGGKHSERYCVYKCVCVCPMCVSLLVRLIKLTLSTLHNDWLGLSASVSLAEVKEGNSFMQDLEQHTQN